MTTAVSGLSKEQALLALSTKNLSNAQKEQVLVAAGIIATDKKITASKVSQALVNSGLSSTEKKLIMMDLGLIDTTTKKAIANASCTREQLLNKLSTKGLVGAEAEAIVSSIGLTTANGAQSVSFDLLTASIWANVKALGAWLVTNPVGWCILAAGAIFGVVKAHDALTVSVDEAKEKLEETVTAYEDSKNELESVNDELKTTIDRINELNEKDNLTFTEQDELDKLVKTNDELERKIYLLEQANKEAEKEVVSQAKNTYDKLTNDRKIGAVEQIDFYSNSSLLEGANWSNHKEDLSWLIAQYRNQQDILNNAQQNGWVNIEEQSKNNIELLEGYMSDASLGYQDLYDTISGISDISMTPELEDAKTNLNDILNITAEILGYGRQQISFDEIWNSDNFKKEKEELLSIASNGEVTAETLTSNEKYNQLLVNTGRTAEKTAEHINALAAEINAQNSKVNETPISFTDTLSQVQSLFKGLDQLDSIYADVYDQEEFDWSSILNNEEFQETFSELGTAYENFISTVSNFPSDISACQDAFDDLATSYIFHNGVLDNVTESTKAATITMLEEQGIANATRMVERALAVNKQFLAKTGIDLANVTYEDINAFLQEQGVASSTKQALAEYQLQKELASGITLDASGDIENLYNLVSACGSAASALQTLYKIKSGNLYGVDANGNRKNGPGISQADYQKILSDAEMEINNAALGIKSKNKIAYNGGATTKKAVEDANKAAKSRQKEAEATWKDFLEKQLALYKAELDAGLISLQEYLGKSKSLLDNFYTEGKISGAEYWSSMKSMYENQSTIYDKVLSAVQRRIDQEIDGINDIIDGLEKQNEVLEKQKDNYDAVLSAVNDLIESKQDKIQDSIDKLSKENEGIEDLISNYDSVLSVVEKVYDKEISVLEDQQKAIDDKIKSLQDENDERKLAIKLEQAKYTLYKSMNQRNVKLFNGAEFIYTTNQDDIRQNQENLANLTLEQTVNGLEKEKDALQNSINELQKYKEMWLEASDARKNALDEQIAKDLLGKDYESLILKNSIRDIEDFKNKYIEARQRLEDNTTLIESYDEKNEYYNKLKEKWSSLTSAKEKAANKQLAIDMFGKNWESAILSDRRATFENFKLKYLEIQSQIEDNTTLIESYNQKIPYYNALKAQWSSISSAYQNSMEDQHAAMVLGQGWEANILNDRLETLTSFRNSYIKTQQDIADSAWRAANEQINAAKAASQAANGNTGSAGSVGNPTTTPTQVKTPTNTKNPTTVTGGHIGAWVKPNTISKYANGGVVSNKDSNELDPIAKALGEDHLVAVRNYERIIPDEKWDLLREQLMIHPVIVPDLIPKIDRSNRVTNNNTTPVIQDIKLTLPNVTNNSGYERVQKELRQMQIDARQFVTR